MTEELEYLLDIASRVESQKKAMDFTKEYLIKKRIRDLKKIENCLVMSQIWAATKYQPYIKVADVLIFLGSTDDLPDENEDLALSEELKELNLKEILDLIIKRKDSII